MDMRSRAEAVLQCRYRYRTGTGAGTGAGTGTGTGGPVVGGDGPGTWPARNVCTCVRSAARCAARARSPSGRTIQGTCESLIR